MRRWSATAGPLATKILIGINVVIYLLTTGASSSPGRTSDLESRFVLFGPAVADGDLYRLITTGFVHFGLIHIGMNMFLLFQFGSQLEPTLGRARFVLLYAAGLLGGAFGALVLSPNALTGGASGAVFGLMGAMAIAMRQRNISLREGGIGGLIVINLVLSVALPGISLGGHLGGLVGGAVVASVMLSPRRRPAEGVAAALVVMALAVMGSVAVAG